MTTTYMYNAVVGLLNKFLPGSGVQNRPEYGLKKTKHKQECNYYVHDEHNSSMLSCLYMR